MKTNQTIFDITKHTLDISSLYNYHNDGLIFTPTNVGISVFKTENIAFRCTWFESYKWKPSNHNTIDFLINIVQDNSGIDSIYNVYTSADENEMVYLQYKKIHLYCGYVVDNTMNPMYTVLKNNTINTMNPNNNNHNHNNYRPYKFRPCNPSDPYAYICNIQYHCDGTMRTENGEKIENNCIIEFRYDTSSIRYTNDNAWNWIPSRVRYDKTKELRDELKRRENDKKEELSINYGNSYKVANDIWTSIHNPISYTNITTGTIKNTSDNTDVYYKPYKNRNQSTIALRNFHNKYIKHTLLLSISKLVTCVNKTLIDVSVGKAGDLYKWIDAKLHFVYGIDINNDNIQNKTDGACVRYLHSCNDNNKLLALFSIGDTSKNIKNGECYNINEIQTATNNIVGIHDNFQTTPQLTISASISHHIFGIQQYHQIEHIPYGICQEGFSISSLQFSLHYYFKDINTLRSLLCNIIECTKISGYFIGTCYDGTKLFHKLQENNIVIKNNVTNNTILEIQKLYTKDIFNDDETSLGYAIKVWQESIHKYNNEYLINFPFFIQLCKEYGLEPLDDIIAKDIGIIHAFASFEDLYIQLQDKHNLHPTTKYGKALFMTEEEKEISFLNKIFVFKRIK
jgi:hypothetical protein